MVVRFKATIFGHEFSCEFPLRMFKDQIHVGEFSIVKCSRLPQAWNFTSLTPYFWLSWSCCLIHFFSEVLKLWNRAFAWSCFQPVLLFTLTWCLTKLLLLGWNFGSSFTCQCAGDHTRVLTCGHTSAFCVLHVDYRLWHKLKGCNLMEWLRRHAEEHTSFLQ